MNVLVVVWLVVPTWVSSLGLGKSPSWSPSEATSVLLDITRTSGAPTLWLRSWFLLVSCPMKVTVCSLCSRDEPKSTLPTWLRTRAGASGIFLCLRGPTAMTMTLCGRLPGNSGNSVGPLEQLLL